MKNIIQYAKLYDYFRSEKGGNLTKKEALRNIWRTRNLPKEFKEVVYMIIEGRPKEVADFQIDGLTIGKLHKDEGMKMLQAVFFLDWLRREPDAAYSFLASGRFRSPLRIVKKRNQEKGEPYNDVPNYMVPEDTSLSDIETEAESDNTGSMTDTPKIED